MKNPQNAYTSILSQIQKYFDEAKIKKAVLGVSGGIDSALTLKLLVDSLGSANVTALIMPENGVTKDENTFHARRLCEFLKVKHHIIAINKYLMDLLHLPWKPSRLAQMNIKARARALILYNFANTETALVIGTSNKSELALGYGTKFGDLACDLMPLADLYKTDVYTLAQHLELPDEFIQKAPSAELYRDQTDEEELGLPYKIIDKILESLESHDSAKSQIEKEELTLKEMVEKGVPEIRIRDIFALMKKNSHKLKTPVAIKL